MDFPYSETVAESKTHSHQNDSEIHWKLIGFIYWFEHQMLADRLWFNFLITISISVI